MTPSRLGDTPAEGIAGPINHTRVIWGRAHVRAQRLGDGQLLDADVGHADVSHLAGAMASDLGAPLTVLRVDGGLTRSRLLLQLQADLAQIPIEVHHSPHATALGVGALAARALGASAATLVSAPALVIEPSISADQASERLERWRTAAEAAVVVSSGRTMPASGR